MCLQIQEHLALQSGATMPSFVDTKTGELNECITGCGETWEWNRISTRWNHSVRWSCTFPIMANPFWKNYGMPYDPRAETALLDEETDNKFTKTNNNPTCKKLHPKSTVVVRWALKRTTTYNKLFIHTYTPDTAGFTQKVISIAIFSYFS